MYKNIPDMLKKRAEKSPDKKAQFTLNKDGKWESHSWSEFYTSAFEIAEKLFNAGLHKGDSVALIAPTSLSWEYIQMGIFIAGGTVVGIDPGEDPLNIEKNIKLCSVKGIIVQDSRFLEKLSNEILETLSFTVTIDNSNSRLTDGVNCLEKLSRKNITEIVIKDNQPAVIIFTSGTTGEQKAVSYTHKQVLITCKALINAFDDIDNDTNLVCWLPLANLFQRMINFCAIEIGANNYFVEDPKKIAELIPQINPHIFIGVPRVFEKIYLGIQSSIEKKNRFVRAVVSYSIKKGEIVSCNIRQGKKTPVLSFFVYKVLDAVILKKIRSFFGNNLKYMISGSAPMPLWLIEKFHALGFLVLEAYGISENIIPNAINTPKDFKFGTVGKPLPENTIKIAPDGELLIKGPGLFSGYYGQDNKSVFDDEGFFPTGDYVKKDDQGYLIIEGRKSEVFKTSTGRKIAPAGIESIIKGIPYIENVVVLGAQKKFIVSIVSVSKTFFENQGIISNIEIVKKMEADISLITKPLPGYKKPAGILVKFDEFSLGNCEITSNLKLRRKAIEKNYEQEIKMIYDFIENNNKSEQCILVGNIAFLII